MRNQWMTRTLLLTWWEQSKKAVRVFSFLHLFCFNIYLDVLWLLVVQLTVMATIHILLIKIIESTKRISTLMMVLVQRMDFGSDKNVSLHPLLNKVRCMEQRISWFTQWIFSQRAANVQCFWIWGLFFMCTKIKLYNSFYNNQNSKFKFFTSWSTYKNRWNSFLCTHSERKNSGAIQKYFQFWLGICNSRR